VIPPLVLGAAAAVGLSVLVLVLLLALPRRAGVPLSRLDPTAADEGSRLARAGLDTSAVAGRLLRRLGRADSLASALERAGIRRSAPDVLVLAAAGALVVAVLGALLGGPLLAVLGLLVCPAATVLLVKQRTTRRQTAFADQLDDALHLMGSSLRAGQSLVRAIDAVSRDTEAPVSEEFARVVNETRVGRDLTSALAEVADRTASPDFAWVVQAIAIHREVGGNLVEVLDQVGVTIRERSQLRRQVASLSAEGRLSAVVLMAMPFVVFGLLLATAPTYVAPLTGTTTGLVLLGASGLLMVVGGFWMRATVRVPF
jgi:tight adherence protein B